MSSKNFHKNLGNYLDVKRNGPKSSSRRKRANREPIMRVIGVHVRQFFRKVKLLMRKTKAFFGADHELDLNSLHQDVFVIERDEKRSTVFWRQVKRLFRTVTFEKKMPTIMKNHIFDKKECMRNKNNPTPSAQPEDVDMSKIDDIIKNNSL